MKIKGKGESEKKKGKDGKQGERCPSPTTIFYGGLF